MQTYSEINHYFYHTHISFAEKDTLILEKKTPISYTKEAIPLVAFSPDSKIIKKGLSILTKCLFAFESLAIVGILILVFQLPSYFSTAQLALMASVICFFLFLSVFYYRNVTKSRLYFYSQTGQAMMMLANPDAKTLKWAQEFGRAIRNARVNFDKDNFEKLSKGIDNLEKQNLINQSFSEELYARLSEVANTNIK